MLLLLLLLLWVVVMLLLVMCMRMVRVRCGWWWLPWWCLCATAPIADCDHGGRPGAAANKTAAIASQARGQLSVELTICHTSAAACRAATRRLCRCCCCCCM